MSVKKLQHSERELVGKVLKGEIGRRDLFRVSALTAATAAIAATPGAGFVSQAAAQEGGPNVKDMSRVMPRTPPANGLNSRPW